MSFDMPIETAALYLAVLLIGGFVLWELTLAWRARRAAHNERIRRDREADRQQPR
jgi:hypothetical protein